MDTIDLVALQGGRPLAVVEVKRVPIPPEFQHAVLKRLKAYGEATQSPWVLLADPQSINIYRQGRWEAPQVTLDTERLVELTEPVRPEVVGRRTLTRVLKSWLRMLGKHRQLAAQSPELADFIRDVAGLEELVEEFHVH